ncbi:acyl-CoA dehydrogenase family protein [Cupriavidus pinatubonensis]|uniref:acyl-CoA dehydrogenase family protein n=1 Tax=Cupriavidus pinatubonensis TaxID=248026 RepID=UPI00112AF8D0|nr:acyl-CoA dehydrogenase [Cupriavidus pinatubonensis]TPQ33947.1 acyl-CoA dehydrogenase [Cupriavidus pinatubonensis]
MVDFTLTPRDEELVNLAREDAAISRKYARYYDQHHELLEPVELPEAKERPDPYALLQEDATGTSGPVVTQSLLHLEYPDVRLRRDSNRFLGTKIIAYAGTAEQVERFGHLLLSIAITEPGAGSDPRAMVGSARYDEAADEWVLNGEKIYCSGFGEAAGAVVMLRGAPDEHGVRPFYSFVVEKGSPGLQVIGQVDKMGMRAWDTADFVLQDCRVPSVNKLNADFKRTLMVFNGSRAMVTAFGLKTARNMLEMVHDNLLKDGNAIDYGRGRNGRSAVHDRVIALEAWHDATKLLILHAKWSEQKQGVTDEGTMVEAAMAKAMGGMAARRITQECMDLLGPLALMEEFLAEKWFRDARIFDIFEGAGEINRLIIARWLLDYSSKDLN